MIRNYPFAFTRSTEEGDGLTLEGYAAVFNAPTKISERGRTFTETVQRGAFKKSLQSRMPALMFNHGGHPVIGDMPLGKITNAREDAHGLYIEARLTDNWLIQPVRDAIADGAIEGMSFRFETIRDKWSSDSTQRVLQEVKVSELGPVGMPAYESTSVGVRNRSREIIEELQDDPEMLRAVVFVDERADETWAPAGDADPPVTSASTPPATPEPAEPPAPSNLRRERLTAVAKLKGLIK